jgi:hypothetical protein
MAVRPDDGPSIGPRVAGERPHHIDQIFGLADGAAPHVLVAMWELRRRAWVKRKRLGEVELDGVAPWLHHSARDSEDQGVLDELAR